MNLNGMILIFSLKSVSFGDRLQKKKYMIETELYALWPHNKPRQSSVWLRKNSQWTPQGRIEIEAKNTEPEVQQDVRIC